MATLRQTWQSCREKLEEAKRPLHSEEHPRKTDLARKAVMALLLHERAGIDVASDLMHAKTHLSDMLLADGYADGEHTANQLAEKEIEAIRAGVGAKLGVSEQRAA